MTERQQAAGQRKRETKAITKVVKKRPAASAKLSQSSSGAPDNRLVKMQLADKFSTVPGKPHAFKSNNVGFILSGQKDAVYVNIKALKDTLLKVLNDEFTTQGDVPHFMLQTSSYIIIRCKYKFCTF